MHTSFESPAKLASTKNQLNISGIDFRILNIITQDNTALKLLVLICLFNRSNCLMPINSILLKSITIDQIVNCNKETKK